MISFVLRAYGFDLSLVPRGKERGKVDGLFLPFEQLSGKGINCQVVLCLSNFKVTEI